jgi:serine O-acetyltransferase
MPKKEIVEKILKSYEAHGGINHLDGTNLPSKEAVAGIAQDCLRILFPGFHDRVPVARDQIGFYTSQLVTSVRERLKTEVLKSFEYRPRKNSDASRLAQEAEEIVDEFLHCIPRVRELLQQDVQAAFDGDPAALSHEEIILAYPGLEAIAVQRLAHHFFKQHVPLIPRIMTEWAHSRTGIDIHPGAEIGTHFFIDHGTGVVIGETTVIGNHVKIYQGVTLGAKSTKEGQKLKDSKRHPTVEDRVTIYANATILGGDTVIGKNSTVAGGVFLVHSVPHDSIVTLEERQLKILKKKSAAASHGDFQI